MYSFHVIYADIFFLYFIILSTSPTSPNKNDDRTNNNKNYQTRHTASTIWVHFVLWLDLQKVSVGKQRVLRLVFKLKRPLMDIQTSIIAKFFL